MDTDQEQAAPEADNSSDGGPAQTVRVPNVSPNAKSGLDHTIIGANALADTPQDTADDADDDPRPDGTLDDNIAWIKAAEDSDTARDRADRVWAAFVKDGDGDNEADNEALATALREAVYGPPADPAPGAPEGDTLLGAVTVPDGLDGEALDAWVSGDVVEGDETTNPERWAAYLARQQAVADLADQHAPTPETSDDPPPPPVEAADPGAAPTE